MCFGRKTSAQGNHLIQLNFREVRVTLTLKSGQQLQLVIFAMQRLRSSFSLIAQLVAPHLKFLKIVYQKAGNRTKRSVARIPLIYLQWTDKKSCRLMRYTKALQERVTLARENQNKRLTI